MLSVSPEILLDVTSLPSQDGIGDLDPTACWASISVTVRSRDGVGARVRATDYPNSPY